MIGLIITGHGHFATGMRSSIELVTGEAENARFVEFLVEDTPESLKEKFGAALAELKDCDGILFLCDLAGGTPYKTAVEYGMTEMKTPVEVVGGVSLPMLLEGSISAAEHNSPLELAEELMECGRDSVERFQLAAPVEPEIEDEADGI